MKNRVPTLMAAAFLISLFGISLFSCHCRFQEEQLNNLVLKKIKTAEEEIIALKNQIEKLNSHINVPSSQEKLEEKNLLNLSDFESQAALRKVVFPNNFFSIFDQKFNLNNKSKKPIQFQQKQLILIKKILEKIITFPKSKIEKLELENEPDSFFRNAHEPGFLVTILLTITMREAQLQRLFNDIATDKDLFVISSVNISNSNPTPPPHHAVYLKEKLVPILGSETVTARLRIKLFDTPSTSPIGTCEWRSAKNQPPLFLSRHYATKNETLIDPINSAQALCPPIPNEWIVNNALDYSNPNILFEDSDQTGFNNLEKWQGDNPIEEPGKFPSDPNNPTSHPLLWTKLRCYQKDISSKIYSIYFLGLRSSKKEKLFQIQPNTPLQSQTNHGRSVFDKKTRYVSMGEQIEGLPYKIVSYQEKQTIHKNTCYDSSELTIEQLDTKEQVVLIKKTPYHMQPCQLTNVTSIKIENTIFEPPQAITLKLGDYFALDYFLPNKGSIDKKTLIERESYQLIGISNSSLTIGKDSHQYKIPIISAAK